MNCRKVKRRLPLYIGQDLSPRSQRSVEEHLRSCTICQNEHSHYLKAVGQTRQWLQRQEHNWDESVWQQAAERVVTKEKDSGRRLWPWPFKPAAAYALMILFAAALALLVVRSSFAPSQTPGDVLQTADIPGSQNVVAVTLVSRDTGLKVQWFFNRNFNIKEDIE